MSTKYSCKKSQNKDLDDFDNNDHDHGNNVEVVDDKQIVINLNKEVNNVSQNSFDVKKKNQLLNIQIVLLHLEFV